MPMFTHIDNHPKPRQLPQASDVPASRALVEYEAEREAERETPHETPRETPRC